MAADAPSSPSSSLLPSSSLFASIDMGTNSFKMVIIQADPSTGKFLPIDRHKDPSVCLGSDSSPSISPSSQLRALHCLHRFSQILNSHRIPLAQSICVATAAVREADNVADFKDAVKEATGLEVVVLSGEAEGRYVYLGVLQFLSVYDKRVLVVDIGGGSTEFVIGKRGNVVFAVSLKLGHVALSRKFKEVEVEEMRQFVRKVIRESGLVDKVEECGFELVVGTSGTVNAIEKAVFCGYGQGLGEQNQVLFRNCERDWKFSRGELRSAVERLCEEGEGGRIRRDEFFKRRSEFIVAGAVLLEEIFLALGIEEMEVSGYALGEGVIAEALARLFDGYDLNANAKWCSVVRLATRFNDKKRMKSAVQCATFAKMIFEGLRRFGDAAENKINLSLDVKDLEYLEAACLLHNIGLFTVKKGYHKESHRIIMNGDHLHGYSCEEAKFIALLTRYHRKKFPTLDQASLKEIPEVFKEKFKVLCAIIRVSVLLQQNNSLKVQHMEFLYSSDGVKLVFREGREQHALPVLDVVDKKLRKELEYLKMTVDSIVHFQTMVVEMRREG